MKVILLRVGVDSAAGKLHGPLFDNDRFEFIPIPDGFGLDERTYGNTVGGHGRRLVDYFPQRRREVTAGQAMHVDPEFETFTYGSPTPAQWGLGKLTAGDLLVFYAGLQRCNTAEPPRLYLIGYFEVILAGRARDFRNEELRRTFMNNMHVRHPAILAQQRERLVLVKGGPGSRLLHRAVPISEKGSTQSGRPMHILSAEMQRIFGPLSGAGSIQRSSPRSIREEYVERAAAFVRGLE